jgi:peptidoglycan hydrolase CwlO-like protein
MEEPPILERMSSQGGSTGGPTAGSPTLHRESRWLGEGYADITKLRELAARHDRLATRFQRRAARLQTRIEKLRHVGAVLREKAQGVLGRVPEIEQEIAQHERNIAASTNRTGGIAIGSDVTDLQYRVRKLQQKVVDLQHKSRTLEHRASQKTQKAAELKVKVDRLLEQVRLEEQEAVSFRKRADRLQVATEGEVAARLAPAADSNPPPPGPA